MSTEASSTITGPDGKDVGRRTGRYLLAIEWLSDGDQRVSTGEIASHLNVSPASVTEMGSKLHAAGLVTVEKYAGVKLTDGGRQLARELAWRHCIVTNFFEGELATPLEDDQSYEIGYALSHDAIDRLHDLVDHPCIDRCPGTIQDYDGCQVA